MEILCPIKWIRMTNVNYSNFLTIRELHTNHELCITNREYVYSVVATLYTINSKHTNYTR